MKKSKQLKIGIVGSGNMAYYLGESLSQSNFPIHAVHCRNEIQGKDLAKKATAIFTTEKDEFLKTCDLFFLCVPDDEIEAVATWFQGAENKILVHHSGTKSVNILSPFSNSAGVLWPIYSINKKSLPTHRNVPFIISTSQTQVGILLTQIADELSNIHQIMDEPSKQNLHLMAVMTNNFMNHLATITQAFAKTKQIDFEWVLPIIAQTANSIQEQEMKNRQTGPARRGDPKTIAQHLALLNTHPEWQKIYQAMTDSIIEFYKKEQL